MSWLVAMMMILVGAIIARFVAIVITVIARPCVVAISGFGISRAAIAWLIAIVVAVVTRAVIASLLLCFVFAVAVTAMVAISINISNS